VQQGIRHTIGMSGSSTASLGPWPRPGQENKAIAVNRVTLGGLACGLALLAACGSSGLSDNGPFGNGGPNSGTISAFWQKCRAGHARQL
jgi:hypothetical protein